MKTISSLLLLFLFSFPLNANENNSNLYIAKNLSIQLSGDIKNSLRVYLEKNKNQTGYTNHSDFRLREISYGNKNYQHFIFDQYFNNIPVFGKTIRAHINNNNILTSISSNIEQIEINTLPIVSTGLQLLERISKQIPPCLFILQ